MKRIFLFSLVFLVFVFTSHGEDNEKDNRFSKLLLGISGIYANYDNLENQIGLSIDASKFLIGFNVGVAVNGFILDFTYGGKVYPVNENVFGEYKVIDLFDVYSLGLGYVFTVFENYLYLGPVVSISVDSSVLKFYRNVNINNFISSEVKNIDSKTLSIGIGLKVIGFRNIFITGYYFYGFPNVYYYDGVLVENSPIFKPQGLRVIASLTF